MNNKLIFGLLLILSSLYTTAQDGGTLITEWSLTCQSKEGKNAYCGWTLDKESIKCLTTDCKLTTTGVRSTNESGIKLLNSLIRQSVKLNIHHENYGIISIHYKEFNDHMECTLVFINLVTMEEEDAWVQIDKIDSNTK